MHNAKRHRTRAERKVRSAKRIAGMRMRIGVMGGADHRTTSIHLKKAFALGREIAKRECILVTGACPGLPLAAADGAQAARGFVIGISPGLSLQEHVQKYGSPAEGHDAMIFTGSGLMGREVVNIRSSDIVIIIGGRSGTLGELAIAYDEGKLIGVLKGTGGITDLVPRIIDVCKKDTGAKVIYASKPSRLLDLLVEEYERNHYRHPSCFGSVKEKSGLRTARDLVCGMWVDPRSAQFSVCFKGESYHFCCKQCARLFRTDPEFFLRKMSNDG